MHDLLIQLKAAAEETRLRILAICAGGELTVSELTHILGQSQPRVSRHLKLLCDAGLLRRFREGSWVFYRRAEGSAVGGAGLQPNTRHRSAVPARHAKVGGGAEKSRGRRRSLFPRKRRRMGQAAFAGCRRSGSRSEDTLPDIGNARSEHHRYRDRHRAHSGTLRAHHRAGRRYRSVS
ncbi:MAG: ArsR family transcriptional regulator [Alphaproteobacteria bacterium]|nr:ArsR family transcriptional regulator [Alphaproteobacteria bacterium]